MLQYYHAIEQFHGKQKNLHLDTSEPIEECNICIYIYVYIYRSHNVWVLFLHKIYSEFVAWKLWEALLSEYKDIMKYNGIKAEEVDIRLWCHSHATTHHHQPPTPFLENTIAYLSPKQT